MNEVPGTLQGGGAGFELTHWSVVLLAAQSQSEEAAQAARASFCQTYWPPLYTFLRRRGHSRGDAQDLVQGFFAHVLEQNTLSRAEREKGHLRTFLLGSLQHFLANEHDRARTLKRGGGQQIVSMEEHFAEAEAAVHTLGDADETLGYDRQWASRLLDEAWGQLRAEFVRQGREQWLNEMKPIVLGGAADPPTQDEIAARLNVSPTALRNALLRLRHRFREALRAEIARTVATSAEVDEEMRYLHRVLLS